MRFIDSSTNKIQKHIDYSNYMLNICYRKSNKLKPYYFEKQIEVSKRKLKTFTKKV